MFQCSPRDDEGSIRQLCGTEDDRRGGADSTQSVDAQDPTAHRLAAQVHLWETHHSQVGEVLHEGAGAGADRAAAAQSCPVVCVKY